jgi:hypothetical protein
VSSSKLQARLADVLRHRRERILRGDLAEGHGAGIAVEEPAHLREELQILRLGVVVPVILV